jgi:uncharacterized repeat protein (TIGR01451 family)
LWSYTAERNKGVYSVTQTNFTSFPLKSFFRFALIFLSMLLLFLWSSASERNAAASPSTQPAPSALWTEVDQTSITLQGERRIVPTQYRTLALNVEALRAILAAAPMEFSEAARTNPAQIDLPLPDGSLARFNFAESPIMEAELEAKFPQIKSYIGRGADDPTLFTRFGWTYKGFHAIIFSHEPTIYIDAYSENDLIHYISYSRDAYERVFDEAFVQYEPEVDPVIAAEIEAFIHDNPEFVIGEQLRTYRLALAATGEYSIFHGGTVPLVLSEMNVAMNRVNGIYEKDTAVRMVLVANNDQIIYLNPATDPYTNNSGGTMLGQNQANLDAVIGNANYDIGHVFSTGGGGVATLRVPCVTGSKARGVTGLSNPINDPFYVDYVAHEMGHQFGANHTFNGNEASCSGNRNSSTAYEPGSGTTIMAYAGICGTQNIQANSDDHFHTHSIQEIVAYTTGSSGNNCPVITNTGNTAPTANAGLGGFTIPRNTPFMLTGSATDPDAGDVLSYNWEQYDLGPAGHPNTPVGNAPLFRSFSSVGTPSRIFPRMTDIVNNTQTIGEILPGITRPLNFRLTVRDNNVYPSAGGVHYSLVTFQVTDAAGPFVVTQPNTAVIWTGGNLETVTWNVANTNSTPVSCANVNIALSEDGGFTYPISLADNVPNNGSYEVIAPNISTNRARVRVMCANNVFFDISNVNFVIEESSAFAALAIEKTAVPTTTLTPGSPLTYTISVANLGEAAATATITDEFPAGLLNPVCDGVPGDLNATVGINASDNISIVCAAQVSDDPVIAIAKSVDREQVNSGEMVTYTITITNTSAVHTLTDVVVDDPAVTGCVPALDAPIILAPLASQTFVCADVAITGNTTNTATATGQFVITNVAFASAPQDPGGVVSDGVETAVIVTASASVTVMLSEQLLFLPLIIGE